MRFTTIIPLILSIAGFVLAMLTLFAGSKTGQMEDFHVIAINMSDFGHNLVPTSTTGGSEPTSTSSGGGLGSFFSHVVETISSEVGDELNDLAGDVADKLAAELGIAQWYSLHLMTACEGSFTPNATAPGAGYGNVTNCTDARAGFQFNLSAVLDHELAVGPLDLSLADLGLPSAVQDAVDYLNKFLLAIFVITCIGAGFAGLSFLACIADVSLSFRAGAGSAGHGRLWALAQVALAGLSAFALMIAAAIITGVAKKGASEINDKGGDVGISAHEGTKLMIISWVAFAVMFVASLYWVGALVLGRRRGGFGSAGRDRHRGWFASKPKSPQMKEHSFESAR